MSRLDMRTVTVLAAAFWALGGYSNEAAGRTDGDAWSISVGVRWRF